MRRSFQHLPGIPCGRACTRCQCSGVLGERGGTGWMFAQVGHDFECNWNSSCEARATLTTLGGKIKSLLCLWNNSAPRSLQTRTSTPSVIAHGLFDCVTSLGFIQNHDTHIRANSDEIQNIQDKPVPAHAALNEASSILAGLQRLGEGKVARKRYLLHDVCDLQPKTHSANRHQYHVEAWVACCGPVHKADTSSVPAWRAIVCFKVGTDSSVACTRKLPDKGRRAHTRPGRTLPTHQLHCLVHVAGRGRRHLSTSTKGLLRPPRVVHEHVSKETLSVRSDLGIVPRVSGQQRKKWARQSNKWVWKFIEINPTHMTGKLIFERFYIILRLKTFELRVNYPFAITTPALDCWNCFSIFVNCPCNFFVSTVYQAILPFPVVIGLLRSELVPHKNLKIELSLSR